MTTYVYLDNSNLYIEGCRIQAVKNQYEENIVEAMNNSTVDHDWQMDYGRLYEFFCDADSVARLWGSPPPGDSFWEMVKRKGWQVQIFDRNQQNKEKKVDVAIAHAMTKDAYKSVDKEKDELILVAGDKDFVPVIEDLVKEGFKVQVAFWSHAAAELRNAATFINLDKHHDHVTKKKVTGA